MIFLLFLDQLSKLQGVAKRLVNFESLELHNLFLGVLLLCCFCALLTVKYGQFITLDLIPMGMIFSF